MYGWILCVPFLSSWGQGTGRAEAGANLENRFIGSRLIKMERSRYFDFQHCTLVVTSQNKSWVSSTAQSLNHSRLEYSEVLIVLHLVEATKLSLDLGLLKKHTHTCSLKSFLYAHYVHGSFSKLITRWNHVQLYVQFTDAIFRFFLLFIHKSAGLVTGLTITRKRVKFFPGLMFQQLLEEHWWLGHHGWIKTSNQVKPKFSFEIRHLPISGFLFCSPKL